jgi:hypothetical protein
MKSLRDLLLFPVFLVFLTVTFIVVSVVVTVEFLFHWMRGWR